MSTLDFPHVADERLRTLLVAVDDLEPGRPVSEGDVLRIRDLTAKHIQAEFLAHLANDIDTPARVESGNVLTKRMELFEAANSLIDHGSLRAASWALVKAWV